MPVAVLSKEKTWSKMFPTTFKTEQQSLVFMKKLFAVAISNIVYIRSIFPEYAFFDKQLEGIKLKILREDSKCPGATKVINWVRGCFDALDRHYLKTVIIGFYTDSEDPDTVIESYSFKFTYGLDNVSVQLDSSKKNESQLETVIKNDDAPEKIKNATLSLLRTMILAGNTQNALPEKVIVTMKLLYYDEITPDDYEPSGFKTCDYAGFRHETETINAKLGHVETDFHSFRMILRTDKTSFTANYAKSSNNNDSEKKSTELASDLIKETPTINNMRTNMTPRVSNIIDEEFIVQCPCGGNKDDGIMIMCENCKNWQHSVCFAIMEEELVPEIHICDSCADKNSSFVPTDLKLKEINFEDRQKLCLIRRAIVYCKSIDVLEPGQLSEALGIEINVGRGVFHTLQKEGLLINSKRKTKNKGLSKVIDKTALESILIKKFLFDLPNTNVSKNDKSYLRRKRSADIVNLSDYTDNMCLKDNALNILNESQDSLFDGQCKKRRRGGIVKTPVVATRF